MELPFETYDVFTETPYRGNPLAVVTVPASLPAPPTQAQKQLVAREFNLSETIFVHEPAQPSSRARDVDIFVTNAEIPFAGHPTIGAAVSLFNTDSGVDTLVTKAGPIPVASAGAGAARAAIPHNVHLHAKRLRHLPASSPHLEGLSTVAALRAAELDAPVYSIVRGMSFILIELTSLEELAQAAASPFTGPVGALLDEGWQEGLCCRFYYVRTGGRRDGEDEVVTLRTRMIDALCEDPATGSASSALCCYLSAVRGEQKTARRRYELTQGVEMGRESNIVVDVTMKGDAIDEVHLSGKAVKVMKGTLII